jgi:NADPH-dependent 2,4-dienoyl-CoA reductase/sulfur reductase-like enzyme
MSKGIERHDIVIVGGGPAGLAAAISAYEAGEHDVLILERDTKLGGILNQCIHNGFGLHTFKEELTGPEYAARYEQRANELGIERRLGTMVVDISADRVVTAVSAEAGITRMQAGAVVLAMGCRERPRGGLATPGYRPAGIFSAGTAQRLVNIEGQLPGREVVILGSGDIGLIMARRMTLEGAHVACVAEIMPYSGGLKRNIVQCLDDFGIPLLLSHTVVDIEGRDRVEAVTIAEVDDHLRPIPGTEVRYPCDTLMLSVGLLPENELSREAGVEISPVTRGPVVDESLQTSIPGVFACGNVLHVHDLVDYVSEEASAAGAQAARFVTEGFEAKGSRGIPVTATDGVRYTVPSFIDPSRMDKLLTVRFRVANEYRDRYVSVYLDDERIQHRKKRVMAPGEMEQVVLKRSDLEARPNLANITIKLEEE